MLSLLTTMNANQQLDKTLDMTIGNDTTTKNNNNKPTINQIATRAH